MSYHIRLLHSDYREYMAIYRFKDHKAFSSYIKETINDEHEINEYNANR